MGGLSDFRRIALFEAITGVDTGTSQTTPVQAPAEQVPPVGVDVTSKDSATSFIGNMDLQKQILGGTLLIIAVLGVINFIKN